MTNASAHQPRPTATKQRTTRANITEQLSALLNTRALAPDQPNNAGPDLRFTSQRLTVFLDHNTPAHQRIEQTRATLDAGWRVLRVDATTLHSRQSLAQAADRIAQAANNTHPETPDWLNAIGRSADFFSGIGLMKQGIRNAGWRTTWANDHDPIKQRLFLHNMRDERIHLDARSILDISPDDIPTAAMFAACFPCTDLSLAGKARGIETGPQSSTYLRFADILDQTADRRPAFVLLENVVGLIHSHQGKDFELCLRRLANAGYTVDAIALDARRFVPQSRPRMFILGVRTELSNPSLITPETLEPTTLRPKRLTDFIATHPDLPWSITPLPEPPTHERTIEDILDPFDPDAPAWWPTERVERLRNQTHAHHLERLQALAELHGTAHATCFRRMRRGKSTAELRFDGLAGCLRTPKGGSAKQILVRQDQQGWRARYLSATECARLMGAEIFRTDAESISENHALFGFGDAVCVPAVTWFVRNAINPIAASAITDKILSPDKILELNNDPDQSTPTSPATAPHSPLR